MSTVFPAVSIRKHRKNEITVKQTVTESLSNFTQPGLRPVLIVVRTFFNSSSLTEIPNVLSISVLLLIPDIDKHFHYLWQHSVSLLYEQHAGHIHGKPDIFFSFFCFQFYLMSARKFKMN